MFILKPSRLSFVEILLAALAQSLEYIFSKSLQHLNSDSLFTINARETGI